jgi:hypothetical protein
MVQCLQYWKVGNAILRSWVEAGWEVATETDFDEQGKMKVLSFLMVNTMLEINENKRKFISD